MSAEERLRQRPDERPDGTPGGHTGLASNHATTATAAAAQTD